MPKATPPVFSADCYRMFFENSPVPMYILDAESLSFVDVNNSATDLYGYDKARFLTMSLMDVVYPGGNRATFPISETEAAVWHHTTKSGSSFYLRAYHQVATLNNKRVFVVQCVNVDDAVSAEENNRKLHHIVNSQKEGLEHILSTVSEVVWAANPQDWKLHYINDYCYEVFGYTKQEMLRNNQLFWQSILPEDLPKLHASTLRAHTSGTSREEFRVRHRDGNIKYVVGTAVFKKGDDGEPDIISGVTVDITRLRIAEDKLKSTIAWLEAIQKETFIDRQNLLAVTNNTRNQIWSIDKNYILTLANEPFKQVMQFKFGYKPTAGDDITKWSAFTDKPDYWALLYRRAFAGEAFAVIDTEKMDGEDFYFKVNFHPIRDTDGDVIGVSCFAEDVTAQRRALVHMQLQNERLKEIAWIQSHKVRGPVASILGLAQLFNYDNICDPDNTQILAGIREASAHLDAAIGEINQKTILNDMG